jgi:hypothetical protein
MRKSGSKRVRSQRKYMRKNVIAGFSAPEEVRPSVAKICRRKSSPHEPLGKRGEPKATLLFCTCHEHCVVRGCRALSSTLSAANSRTGPAPSRHDPLYGELETSSLATFPALMDNLMDNASRDH